MKYFKVVFGRWIDLSEPAFDNCYEALREWAKGKEKFFVQKPTLEDAEQYAKTFEGIETNSYEGLGGLQEITEISEAEAKEYLTTLAVYEAYRRRR